MNKETLEKIVSIVKVNEPMCEHLSMKVGGPADFFVEPGNAQQVSELVKALKDDKYYIMGRGTKFFVKDEGYHGVMICILDNMSRITVEGTVIKAQAGALTADVSRAALEAGLTGFEWAEGIPGAIGGGIFMNAGAYEGEFADSVKSVTAVDKDGNIVVFKREELDFGYRKSVFSDGGYVIIEAEIELKAGDKDEIKARMDDFHTQRAEKQPLEYPSCGSIFKRPEGCFAGELISKCGMSGARVGGASVSRKHCGFIINDKGATASNVSGLIRLIQRNVKDKLGISLECEVKEL